MVQPQIVFLPLQCRIVLFVAKKRVFEDCGSANVWSSQGGDLFKWWFGCCGYSVSDVFPQTTHSVFYSKCCELSTQKNPKNSVWLRDVLSQCTDSCINKDEVLVHVCSPFGGSLNNPQGFWHRVGSKEQMQESSRGGIDPTLGGGHEIEC